MACLIVIYYIQVKRKAIRIEEKDFERSDGSGCLVMLTAKFTERGIGIIELLTNKRIKKSKAKAARLCGVGEEKNYKHLKI